MRQPDVLILGGGVIGCAVAYHLTRLSSLRVVLVERAGIGAGAANAAAGVLAVGSSRARGVLFDLRRRSAAMFPDLVAALHAETGMDARYVQRGLVELAFTTREAEALRRLCHRRRAQGFGAEWLDAGATRELEPDVSAQIVAGACFADDHTIDSERFTAALAAAARRRGAAVQLGTPVTAVETGRQRVLRVRAGAEWFSPGVVVLAAGAWSVEIARMLRLRLPLRPARGEMLALRPRSPLPLRTVAWGDGYLVPRPDGELLVGGTHEETDEAMPTARGAGILLRRALRMMPTLADATVSRSWAGVRPCPTIRRPLIGPARGFDNLLLATGHHRNGILLAPITGLLIAELLTERATSVALQPFGYRPR